MSEKPTNIYLDNAASTPLDPAVWEAMLPWLTEYYGNPQSLHRMGNRAKKAIDTAKEQIAHTLHTDPEKVIFTSGGSMANNLAVFSAAKQLGSSAKAFTTPIEHSSLLAPMQAAFEQLQYAKVDNAGHLQTLPDPNTKFASIQYANNELGTLQDMEQITKYCRSNGILLHSDAVAAFSHTPIDLKKTPIDLLSLSAHKFGGPQGIGALIVRDKRLLTPFVYGNNKTSPIAGTENVAGIVGMGMAAKRTSEHLQENMQHLTKLQQLLSKQLISLLPDIRVLTPENKAVCGILSLLIPGVNSEGLLSLLDLYGICASAGSACHAGEKTTSHVLTAIGLPQEDAKSVIRLSVGVQNTEAEMLHAASILADSITKLRNMR